MLLRVGPFLSLLDDFSYFTYHGTEYDLGFELISEACWNWSSAKWVPPALLTNLLPFSLSASDASAVKWIPDTQLVTPKRLQMENEDIFFLNNCKGFLIYTAPTSIAMFLILWKIYWLGRNYRLAALIKSFSSWAYLVIALIGDNMQYLSFRCF